MLSLKWDILWDQRKIMVFAPKTERYADQGIREIPFFPHVEECLLDAAKQAREGAVYVVENMPPVSTWQEGTYLISVVRAISVRCSQRSSIGPGAFLGLNGFTICGRRSRRICLERVWELGENIDIGRFSGRCYVIVSSNFVPWNHFTEAKQWTNKRKPGNRTRPI